MPEDNNNRPDVPVTAADLDQLTSLFRLLSDKTRLNILMLLSQGEKNVTHLCDELQLPQPTVSHHLGLLRMNNVIGNRRVGKQVFYALHNGVGMNEEGLEFNAAKYAIKIAANEMQSRSDA